MDIGVVKGMFFSLVSSVIVVMRLPISCVSSMAMSTSTAVSTANG